MHSSVEMRLISNFNSPTNMNRVSVFHRYSVFNTNFPFFCFPDNCSLQDGQNINRYSDQHLFSCTYKLYKHLNIVSRPASKMSNYSFKGHFNIYFFFHWNLKVMSHPWHPVYLKCRLWEELRFPTNLYSFVSFGKTHKLHNAIDHWLAGVTGQAHVTLDAVTKEKRAVYTNYCGNEVKVEQGVLGRRGERWKGTVDWRMDSMWAAERKVRSFWGDDEMLVFVVWNTDLLLLSLSEFENLWRQKWSHSLTTVGRANCWVIAKLWVAHKKLHLLRKVMRWVNIFLSNCSFKGQAWTFDPQQSDDSFLHTSLLLMGKPNHYKYTL